MSGLLYGIGAAVAVIGVVLIGFGIPINEFSFGNTLIISGAIALVGGLIIVALGVVVAQLHRLADVLPARAPLRSGRPLDTFEPAAPARTAPQMPFPSKPKADVTLHEPHSVTPAMAPARPTDYEPAPMLRNPYESPATVEDDVSLSPPQHPVSAPAAADFDDGVADSRHEPPQTAYFDAMWPAENKPAKAAEKNSADIAPAPQMPKPRQTPEPRSVTILKSGVVDGMGYTLYVDGSIEAELPQGTLRFASINELRSHLENNA